MMKKGKLTICRHGIIDEDYISLQIADKNSSKPVIEAKISLEHFMRALTNLSSVEMEYEVRQEFAELWGKTVEAKDILIPMSYEKISTNNEEMKKEVERYFKSMQNKGVYGEEWMIKSDGTSRQQNVAGMWKITICRYIEDTKEQA